MTIEIQAAVKIISQLLQIAEKLLLSALPIDENIGSSGESWSHLNDEDAAFTLTLDDALKNTRSVGEIKVCKTQSRTEFHPEVSEMNEYKGYIRREEYLDENDPLYKAGNSIENRKKAPKTEIPGDVFDRQRVMVGFDQSLIERQSCLVIGTGGIGMDTALCLARLGVGRITVLDYDIVEASNLTRQCLAGVSDIGSAKVDAAQRILLSHHNLRSRIEALNIDVVKNWGTVVSLAKESTVIFNAVDVGTLYDFCVNSLAKELQIPLVAGQSLGWKFMTEIYSGMPGEVCAFCEDTTKSTFGLTTNRDKIVERLIAATVSRSKASSKSNLALDTKLMLDILAADSQFRIDPKCTESIQVVHEAIEMVRSKSHNKKQQKLGSLPINADSITRFLEAYHDISMDKLMPGEITKLNSVAFIPHPEVTATRFVGSWVCPCLGCAVMMVSHFANYLTGPTGRKPPTNMVVNLDDGMTGVEKMAYELAAFGMTVDSNSRSFSRGTTSKPQCSVCKASVLVKKMRESLYFGDEKVYLKPTAGIACGLPVWDSAASPSKMKNLETTARDRFTPFELEDGKIIVQPALPVVDLPINGISALDANIPSDLTMLPLLKCNENEAKNWPSSLDGVASGKRSAIVFVKGKAFRLKGCGNLDEGFPIEKHGDHGEYMVRGCMFDQTVQREFYMSERVSNALKVEGLKHMQCANKSLGFYSYGLASDRKRSGEFCGVFETIGDRRLGDHLLSGIESIIPLLYTSSFKDLGSDWTEKTKNHVEKIRGNLWDTATRAECGMEALDLSNLHIFENPPFYSSDKRCVTMIPSEYSTLWDSICDELATSLRSLKGADMSSKSVLLWLAKMIGTECGQVCRALKKSRISWGTYPDAMGIHCNAHANNMVVRRDRMDKESYLCPLDFDMAFSESEFLPSMIESQHQKIFPTEFDDLLVWEHNMGFRTSLAGSDYTSTGVTNKNGSSIIFEGMEDFLILVRIAFRDTMVKFFDDALKGSDSDDEEDNNAERSKAADSIVKLALICTSKIVC